jgi:para-aminobenzoate synthetase/4-amino-4-deoxychorismate lyase
VIKRVILHNAAESCWLHFANPVATIAATSTTEVQPQLRRVEEAVNQQQLYAAGFITYEAAPAFDPAYRVRPPAPTSLPLLCFGLYRQAELIPLPPPQPVTLPGPWASLMDRQEYEQAVLRIKEYIAAGETYQVNYTFRLQAPFAGDPWEFFLQLVQAQAGQYAAYIETDRRVICSASPELFFRRAGPTLTLQPMKGTATRGRTLAEDKAHIRGLHHSAKNRAENVMIVDMIRNDLGKIANLGTVHVPGLFQIERYPTLLQMTSTVTAQSKASTAEVMAALFPCASITGAPKVRTMKIIAELEAEPRGIYTGCIGFIAPGQRAQFSVAIRTAEIDPAAGLAEYGVGSGIVWDSNGPAEFDECHLKAAILTQESPSFDLLETILWRTEGGYFLLEEHLQRLADSAEYFGVPFNLEQTRATLQGLRLSGPAHKVRLLLSPNGLVSTEAIPLPAQPAGQRLRVALALRPIDQNDPFLYHKTTHRQLYNSARAAQPDYDDVLLWNARGEITEACIANVVAQWGDDLFTPPVGCGLLPGTYRAHLLAQKIIRERVITIDEIKHSSKIYLINSVRRWLPADLIW